MATGLLYVSAKPLALRPSALTTLAMKPHFKNKDWQLQPYDVMRYQWQGHPPGLALSLVDLDSTKEKVADPPSLPPLPRNSVDTEQENQKRSAKATAPDENSEDNMPGDEADLPPELIPVLQDDGLPLLEEGEDLQAIVMDESDGSEDFDIYDIKHTPDFDPDQDYERKFFTYDIDTWVKADQKEAVDGARPRIYEMLNVPKEPIIDMIRSDHYDASPLTPSSTLAPYLSIYQIPSKMHLNAEEGDAEFMCMFHRYAYLTSHEHLRRVSCFRQDSPSFPRWLLLQEFADLWEDTALKKRESEYWWHKNGWNGVIVEFFQRATGE